jgi:ubiquinone biosynthesis protein
VFAKHGFQELAKKLRLGRFLIDRLNATENIESLTVPERLRMAFEELGPTFVKLGQLLATRPDLVPEDYVLEFSKLHDRVLPLSFEVVEEVLSAELGSDYKQRIRSIDPEPLGSASIAQVHRATLTNGDEIVLKVQRPKIIEIISDDLNVLYLLADLLNKYIPEARLFSPRAIVDEYFKTLELETNFVVEANNIRRFQKNFASEPKIKIPKVNFELTTEKVLVMEALHGTPLSQMEGFSQQRELAQEVIRTGLRAYLKMVFVDGLFHGDLHAGNFFICANQQVGLIDFGVVGRLNSRTQASIASMLMALAKEDYERLAYEYVDLAPFTDQVNVDLLAKELRELIAPYYGLTLRNVNFGKLLMSTSSIAARHHLAVPTELMMFFKSLIAVEGLGRRIQKDFDFLQYSLEFAGELLKYQLEPQKMAVEFNTLARESKALVQILPRQLNFLFRKINSPDYSTRIRINGLEEIKKSLEVSFNLMFLGLVIAALIISGSLIFTHPSETMIWKIPTMSFILYALAGFLGVFGFINYIKKP